MQVISEGVNQVDGALTCFWFGVSWFQDCKRGKNNKRKVNINTHSSIKKRTLAVALSKPIARDHLISGVGLFKACV